MNKFKYGDGVEVSDLSKKWHADTKAEIAEIKEKIQKLEQKLEKK